MPWLNLQPPHLFVGLDVGLGDDVTVNEDADDDRMTMMMMVSWKLKGSAKTLLNTNCGYRNWTLYCWHDLSQTHSGHCCYGNSLHFL